MGGRCPVVKTTSMAIEIYTASKPARSALVVIGELSVMAENAGVERGGGTAGLIDEKDLVASIKALEIAHFPEISASQSARTILLYLVILLQKLR